MWEPEIMKEFEKNHLFIEVKFGRRKFMIAYEEISNLNEIGEQLLCEELIKKNLL